MEYFTNTRHNMDIEEIKNTDNLKVEEFKNTGLLYLLEIIGCVGFVSLCVLINILLVYGALRRKRWFLIHWLLLHLLLLFTISILLYILPTNFYKLVGLVPTIVAILDLYCWVKVYQLFISLRHLPGTDTPPPSCNHRSSPNTLPSPYLLYSHSHHSQEVDRDGREVGSNRMEKLGPGVEFYPVDPLSREMGERVRILNMSLSNMVHLPSENVEGSPTLTSCTEIATPTYQQWGGGTAPCTGQYMPKLSAYIKKEMPGNWGSSIRELQGTAGDSSYGGGAVCRSVLARS